MVQHRNAGADSQDAQRPNVAKQVRDSVVLSDAMIVQTVNEVVGAFEPHMRERYLRHLRASPDFAASIKRVTVDVGVVLTLAKTFEEDEAFSDCAGLLHDVRFTAHSGAIGEYAKAIVSSELQEVRRMAGDGDDLDDVMILNDLLPRETIESRLTLLLAFIDQAMLVAA